MAKYRIECKEPKTDWFVHLDNCTFSSAKRHLIIAIENDADDQPLDTDFDLLDCLVYDVEKWASFNDVRTIGECGYEYRIVRDEGEHRKVEEKLAMEDN